MFVVKRRTGRAVAVTLALGLQFSMAAPACATRVFGSTDIGFGAGNSMTLSDPAPASDDTTLHAQTGPDGTSSARHDTRAITAVPKPSSWLLILAGFGLLGIATRRSSPTQHQAQQTF